MALTDTIEQVRCLSLKSAAGPLRGGREQPNWDFSAERIEEKQGSSGAETHRAYIASFLPLDSWPQPFFTFFFRGGNKGVDATAESLIHAGSQSASGVTGATVVEVFIAGQNYGGRVLDRVVFNTAIYYANLTTAKERPHYAVAFLHSRKVETVAGMVAVEHAAPA